MMETGSGSIYLVEQVASTLMAVLIWIPNLRAAVLTEVKERIRLRELDIPGTYPEERWKKSRGVSL